MQQPLRAEGIPTPQNALCSSSERTLGDRLRRSEVHERYAVITILIPKLTASDMDDSAEDK